MSLLPSSPDISPDGDPRVVGLDSEEADDLMAALSSTTARRLVAELHEEPAPPGELADRVDTSLQNAQYHLENLEDADVIEVVGTAYSEKGREMRVYGPSDSPLVIFAGEKERASGLRAALSRLFGGFAALALGGLAVQELFGTSVLSSTDDAPAGEPADTPTPEPEPTEAPDDDDEVGAFDEPTEEADEAAETPVMEETPTPTDAPDAGAEAVEALFAVGLPPGLAFFLGGAAVLTVVVAMTYLRGRP